MESLSAHMEELLVHFDIYAENSKLIAKVKSEMGGLREFRLNRFVRLTSI